jgi:hypothetical protein
VSKPLNAANQIIFTCSPSGSIDDVDYKQMEALKKFKAFLLKQN